MQYVNIKGKSFSKIVCGTNAFYARSHFSEARSSEYKQRFTDEYLKQVLVNCINHGVNAVESSANERITRLLQEITGDIDSQVYFIGNTRIDETSQMKSHQQKLTYLLDHKSEICIIHSQFADRPRKGNEIKGLKPMLEKIHAAGLITGISTHKISTVELCEEQNYPIDVYLFPLNMTGFVYPGYDDHETVEERIKLIKTCEKPFILMKTLAAGRIPPDEGLPFVLQNSKPHDIITLGLCSLEETEESLSIIAQHL